jgi:hypothetical protein
LAGLFGVEIAFHAELANHIHVVVRTRPDVVRTWSDEEVVRRWLIVTRLKRNGADKLVEPTAAKIAKELNKPGRVAKLRGRLADVSWFMGALCENISRRCNREDRCSGAFWEHRYKCRDLADEASILVCGIYVDLNQIRAGEAATPEDSRHTSIYNRIQGALQRRSQATTAVESVPPDGWLCELTLQEEQAQADESPCPAWRASNKGLLSISLEKYLELLEWTGRQIRSGRRRSIPSSLAPILDRLGINRANWLEMTESFDDWFGLVVGSLAAIKSAAERAGRRWFRGQSRCAEAFG